jgi:hypothetical protein
LTRSARGVGDDATEWSVLDKILAVDTVLGAL